MAKTKGKKPKKLYELLSRCSNKSTDKLNVDAVENALLDDPEASTRCYHWGNSDHMYPLWKAISLRASRDVVELIYDAYPEASTVCGPILDNPNILHHACMVRAPLDVVKFLIDKHPGALMETTSILNHLPLHSACGGNHMSAAANASDLAVIQLLVEHFPESVHGRARYSDNTALQILEQRHMDRLGDHAGTIQWLKAVSRPLEILSSPESTLEQMITILRTFGRQKWRGGVSLVFSAQPTLIQQLDLPPGVMPRLLSLVGARCKLQILYSAIRGEPNLLQHARAVRRSKRKRKGNS